MKQTLIPGANAALTTTNITVRIDSDTALDTAIWRLAADGKVRGDGDMIFYNQPASDDGSVHYHGDHYRLDLARQPAAVTRLIIACCSAQPLAQQRRLELHLDDGGRVLHCPVILDDRRETTLILGEIYRRDGAWKYRFIDQGYQGGLRPLCERFGVEIADDEAAEAIAPVATAAPHNPLHGANWHESDTLTSPAQHQPLADWFQQKNVRPHFNYAAVDMRGYYDEAAALLGKQHALFKELLGQINWAYRHRHHGIKHDLKKYPPQDAQRLQTYCRTSTTTPCLPAATTTKPTKPCICNSSRRSRCANSSTAAGWNGLPWANCCTRRHSAVRITASPVRATSKSPWPRMKNTSWT